jgi:hypothetical protein
MPMDKPRIVVPSLTFERSIAGELGCSGKESLEYDESVRGRFRTHAQERWADYISRLGYPPDFAWKRLIELTREQAAKQPTDPEVQKNLWLLGLEPQGGPQIALMELELALHRSETLLNQATLEEQRGPAVELQAKVGCKIVHQMVDKYTGDVAADVEITIRSSGERLTFHCCYATGKDPIFRANYSIALGRVAGGLKVGEKWCEFPGGPAIRKLTAGEELAVQYLSVFSPICPH